MCRWFDSAPGHQQPCALAPFSGSGAFLQTWSTFYKSEAVMSATTIGRRYERLLFWAGPLAFISVLVMFVAFASEKQDERRQARCLRSAAEVVAQNLSVLEQARQGKSVVIDGNVAASYWSAIRFVMIPWEVRNPECEQHLRRYEIDDKIPAPQPLLEGIRKQATALEARPLTLYGVELPEKATLSLVGTPIKMDLLTLVRVMQVALGPMLLLWLGSLYNTRQRETLYIARMTDVSFLYPHLINVYPVILRGDAAWDTPRKKSWTKYAFEFFAFPALYALTRIGLLSAFVGPPVAFYLTSVYMLSGDAYSLVSTVMGFVVAIFALGNVLCEGFPWHVRKRFVVPRRSI